MATDIKVQGYPDNLRALSVTILSGASVSEMFATQGWAIVGIEMPSSWTAAKLAYKSCLSGNDSKLQAVKDNGGNYEKTAVAASINVAIPQSDTLFTAFCQLVSVDATEASTSVTPVAQGGDRTIGLLLRKYLS